MPQGKRTALITGATRGIGLETARLLLQRGVRVVITGRNPEDLARAERDLGGDGSGVTALRMDVSRLSTIEAAVASVAGTPDGLDILINNAAVRLERYGRAPSEQPIEDWRETFETNIFGVVAVTQAFLPLLRTSPAGRIVNVSSLLGSISTQGDHTSYVHSDKFKSLPAYSASKSALNSWTVHLAYELRGTAIKVNAVHPGYTRTGLNDGDGAQDADIGAITSVRMALIGDDGPTGRFVHLDETIPW